NNEKGFTLVEILVSIAIFAIGGVAILALFIAMSERQRQSAEITRGTEIAANVRNQLVACMKLPIKRDGERIYRQISFPFASLDPDIGRREKEAANRRFESTDSVGTNTFFFELPREQYQGLEGFASNPDTVTNLPNELKDGGLREFKVGSPERDPLVFFCLPSAFNSVRDKLDTPESVDFDDTGNYSFRVSIRRSTMRSEYSRNQAGSRYDGQKELLQGVYVCQVRVYKGYKLGGGNIPVVEETFTIVAPDVPAKEGQQ
ncbi:MAG: prepilin-type N-terminal cleavage/methylation domain-containing protein, partial [Planctomycetes bacterium]|nr:prepilin-type N-terminal cleavage/methylation domain-containing protein [Planctomycetota bacterium]